MKPLFHCTVTSFVIVLLSACSDAPQAQAPNEGDASNSSVTFYSQTPSDNEPEITPLAISGITCDLDSETREVRIELGEDGHLLVRDEHRLPEEAWLIVINLARFDIPGGKRDTIVPSRASTPFQMDEAGNIQGAYGFRLHGDLKGQYGLEMDIRC